MMLRRAPYALLPLLAACSATVAEPVAGPIQVIAAAPVAEEPSPQPAADYSFEGRYALVAFDGAPLDNPFENTRPTLLIDARDIHFSSQCISHHWSWTESQGVIRTGRYVPPPAPDGAVYGMCARGLTGFEEAAADAFAAVETSALQQNGDLLVTGSGHRLEFERLSQPDVNLRGMWRVAAIGGAALSPDTRLILGGNETQLFWEPACAGQRMEYSLDLQNDWAGWSARHVDTAGQIVCQIRVAPQLAEVWRALEAVDRAEWTTDGRLRFTGNGRSVLLARFEESGT